MKSALSGLTDRLRAKSTGTHPQDDGQRFVAARPGDDAATLQARMAEHGHVFFPGALPTEPVLAARAEAIRLLRQAGWVAPGGPYEARWSGEKPPPGDLEPQWLAFYHQWRSQPAFNELPEHPALLAIAEQFLGDEVIVHQRKIGRVGFPQNEGHQTPVHQDFFHIRGTTETYTMWVPLGDCARVLGCLSIADGSHRFGFTEHTPSEGAGAMSVRPEADVTWRSQDFHAGDVVLFHSLTMHCALPNRTPDEVRISLDNRYQRRGDPIEPSSMQPHM